MAQMGPQVERGIQVNLGTGFRDEWVSLEDAVWAKLFPPYESSPSSGEQKIIEMMTRLLGSLDEHIGRSVVAHTLGVHPGNVRYAMQEYSVRR